MTAPAHPAAGSATGTPRRRAFHPLAVAGVEPLCDDAVAVTFAVPAELADEFDFAAGQSLTLRRVVDGVEHRRSYSICAPAGAAPRVGVREVTGGLFSRWLVHEVRAGDTVEVQGPTGTFAADPAAGGVHVLIAAGSGITPMLSIAATVLTNPAARVILVYGNRRTRSVMFADEIADLKDTFHDRFEVIHVLSREPRDVELFTGRVDSERLRELLAAVIPAADVDHFWLCGPQGMVADAEAVLADRGVDRSRIHRELFYVAEDLGADGAPPQEHHREPGVTGPATAVTVVLDGRTATGTVPRDEPLLDGAETFRPDLPFACKGGVCGTCRAKVVCGTVDMRRNYALEDYEVDAGFVLTCQSYPTSDAVTVDFDA